MPKSYEEGIARLEDCIQRLNSTDTTLSDSLKIYKEAAELISYCEKALEKATLEMEEVTNRLSIPDKESSKDDL